jgi:hypothetical protein
MTKDWGRLAHEAAEAHLEAIFQAEEDGDDSPSVAPYDGCQTCDIREILAGAWPVIEQMLREQITDAVNAALERDREETDS